MRAYYLSAVMTLWLFGPEYMFLGAIILTLIMYKQDHCCAEDWLGNAGAGGVGALRSAQK